MTFPGKRMERINHMVENLNDLQIFVNRIEKEYGDRIAYRYLSGDSIIDKTFAELAKDIHAAASWFVKNGYAGYTTVFYAVDG